MAGTIGIILEQLRAARSERAVVERLHRSHAQRALRTAIRLRRARRPFLHHRFVALRQHGVDANRQLTLCVERLERVHQIAIGAGFVDRHEPAARHLGESVADALLELSRGGRRNGAGEEP